MKYRKGEAVILAYPNNPLYRGDEVEILNYASRSKGYYEVKIIRTNEIVTASDEQLVPLDDRLAIVRWEDCPWIPRHLRNSG